MLPHLPHFFVIETSTLEGPLQKNAAVVQAYQTETNKHPADKNSSMAQ